MPTYAGTTTQEIADRVDQHRNQIPRTKFQIRDVYAYPRVWGGAKAYEWEELMASKGCRTRAGGIAYDETGWVNCYTFVFDDEPLPPLPIAGSSF